MKNINNMTPLVSVIIPVYNGEKYLAEAIESVLAQKYQPIEIIVVDDGSTDQSAEVISHYGNQVRYIYQKNGGAASARNRGIEMSTGDVLCFVDADDLWSPDKLEIQLKCFAKHPSVEIVLGRTQRIHPAGRGGDGNGECVFKEWAEPEIAMHLGPAAIKRPVFEKVGFFDGTLRYCEDWDWFMRAKEMDISFLLHNEVIYFYRRHEHNMTNDTDEGFAFALKMLRKSLNRRREQASGGEIRQLPKISDSGTGNHAK